MTIEEALKTEISTVLPDLKIFDVETDNTDEPAPYLVINLIDGSPQFPSGFQGRWQLTGADTDKETLRNTMGAIKFLLHNMIGDVGGMPIASIKCIGELPISPKDDSGICRKSIDLEIFYR